jgi:hypothetical protein
MIEIAISLAIIGFALVAIIGVLPKGLNVQKENRQDTLINFDATFLMNALRSGAGQNYPLGLPQGQNDLTNYVIAITNYVSILNTNGVPQTSPAVSWYFNSTQYLVGGTVHPGNALTNGAIIIGLLSTPKYTLTNFNGRTMIASNNVTADFRALNGNALDQGFSQASRDFAFSYRVTTELVPSANTPFLGTNSINVGNWINLSAPTTNALGLPVLVPPSTNDTLFHSNELLAAQNLQGNLADIRLRFRWPVLPNGGVGAGSEVFRSAAGGGMTNIGGPGGVTLYFIQPQLYTPGQ